MISCLWCVGFEGEFEGRWTNQVLVHSAREKMGSSILGHLDVGSFLEIVARHQPPLLQIETAQKALSRSLECSLVGVLGTFRSHLNPR